MYEIYSLTEWQWWYQFVVFFVACIISWFVPAITLLSFTSLRKQAQLVAAPGLGMSLWALQAYIFGWLNLRWLTIAYLLMFTTLFIIRHKKILPVSWSLKIPKRIISLIILGSVVQLNPVFLSGLRTDDGIPFYFLNAFDGLFHLSLARATIEQIPPIQPGASDLVVTNYHYFSNLTLGELSRIWGISLTHTYFQYLPMFWTLWFGVLIFFILQNWTSSVKAAVAALVLFYLSGEITWVFSMVLRTLSENRFSVFIDSGVVQFLNPPQALAKAIFLTIIFLWRHFWQKKEVLLSLLIGLLTATLLGFKVYFGLFLGLGYGCVVFAEVIKAFFQKKTFSNIAKKAFPPQTIMLLFTSAFIGAIIYLPANRNAGGMFFDLLTWPKLLLGFEKLNWNEWWLRLQVYQEANNLRALLFWYGLALAIFLMSIFHFRLIAFMELIKTHSALINSEKLLLLIPSLIFVFIGLNFIQISGGHNSFNFFVTALTVLNLVSALFFSDTKKYKITLLPIAFISLSLVQTVVLGHHYLRNYLMRTDRQVISEKHEELLKELSKFPKNSVVQQHPSNFLNDYGPYQFFFTGHHSYFGGRNILSSHNQPVEERKQVIDGLFTANTIKSAQIASSENISALLLMKQGREGDFLRTQASTSSQSALPHWRLVFENTEGAILIPIKPPTTQQDQ